ncbi:SusC/RagA family TonB-linked outer membrane protein [Marinifilum sp. D737]|uniref:SusC/RagA family TonB-linked outer membrane protein n=1 Tax=Marinifilum sp. D737 TaxID=2969628 RepID=UPI002276ABC4|nr:SusC/RagA family TonB-linked outer membrane protein [Marinifilum sp. D737]MCY1633454.1 SusC/RagA family TonB-linked outer membrane protein [Marinifilum sp. D737]
MYDKIRKKYRFSTNKFSTVCKISVINNGCKVLVGLVFKLFLVVISFESYSQSIPISLNLMGQSMPFEDFFQEIESQTNVSFVYNTDRIKGYFANIPDKEALPLEELLSLVLHPQGFSFVLYQDKIIIRKSSGQVPATKLKAANPTDVAQMVKVQKIMIGRVLCDEDGLPIVGASVKVKNEARGTASDKDGYYTLNCLVGDTIIFSAIGFNSSETVVGLKMIEDIRLSTDVINLKEVNIIGYGEEAKEEQIGAVSSVTNSMTGEVPNNLDETLAGTASGVWFQKSSGVPGSSSTIAIRGVTSLQPDANSPLIVVDGVPLFNTEEGLSRITYQTVSGGQAFGLFDNYVYNDLRESTFFQKNGLNVVNPEDIESISILKDAFSTSIYGSRGAAGVILINTKHPEKFGLKVNLLMETGISKPVNKPDLMNGEKYSSFYSNYYSQLKKKEVVFPNDINTNWYDKVVRNATSNKLALSIQNKKHNGFLYFSFSHLTQESYVIGADYKRYTARFNFQQKINNRFLIGSNISLTAEKNNSLLAPKIYRDAILKAPNLPIYNSDGGFNFSTERNPYGDYTENPVAMALNDKGEILDNYIIANVYTDLQIVNNLSYRCDLGVNFIETDALSSYRNSYQNDEKLTIETDGYSRKYVITNTLTGNKSFGDHKLKFVLGQSFEHSRQKEEQLNYQSPYRINNRNSYELTDYSTSKRKHALASWFGRLNYNYKQKIFTGISYRIDGSSRFNKDNRYQIFPAFSAGYIVLNKEGEEIINNLKLRASFGYSGVEQSTYTYGALRTYEPHQDELTYGNKNIITEARSSSFNLSWEKTENFDVGIDMSLLSNNVHLNLDYYSKKVNNLLLFTDVPAISGYTKQWVNVGAMKNTGIELTCDAKILGGELSWDVFLTAAYNRNKVLEINQNGYEVWGADKAYKYFEEGKEAGQFMLYQWEGVNPENGNPLWRYADGTLRETPPTNLNDRKALGSGIPKYSGGVSNIVSYKGIEFSAFLVFAEGKKLMNGTAAILNTYTTTEVNNLSVDVANYWRSEGEINSRPALFNKSITAQNNYTTSRTSSRFYEDASFIRLKKLVLAYNFPMKFVKKLKLDKIKLYAQATNLFTITNYSGLDPEVSAFGVSSLLSGYDEITMPQTKTYSLGLRIGF